MRLDSAWGWAEEADALDDAVPPCGGTFTPSIAILIALERTLTAQPGACARGAAKFASGP